MTTDSFDTLSRSIIKPFSSEKTTDKVLTIDNWWDAPLSGLCTFGGEYCVFERVFSEEKDDRSDEYRLTPVDKAARKIIEDHRRWCEFMNNGGNAKEWKSTVDINKIAKGSPRYREFTRFALFKGKFTGCCDELKDYFVEWS